MNNQNTLEKSLAQFREAVESMGNIEIIGLLKEFRKNIETSTKTSMQYDEYSQMIGILEQALNCRSLKTRW